MLRLSLGKLYLDRDQAGTALAHLRRATELDRGYSAAWKWLGKALAADGQTDAARDAYRRGIEAAQGRGDKQAEKEMRVFLRRLQAGAGGE